MLSITSLCMLFFLLAGIFQRAASQSIFLLPNANITKYQSTIIVPAPPTVLQSKGKNASQVQAIWPGMQPSSSSVVLQNVLANEGTVLGQWWFIPFYCCAPTLRLTHSILVHPGDAITSTFTLSPFTGLWLDTWTLTPGPLGHALGQVPLSNSTSFDPSLYTDYGRFQEILLAIELQGGAAWGSGTVVWKNILVEVEGIETGWCSESTIHTQNLLWTSTLPIATTWGNKTTCYIADIFFEMPLNETAAAERRDEQGANKEIRH